jgi:hypothetical protein
MTLAANGIFWNGVGAIAHVFMGHVIWPLAPGLILGALLGSYLGASFGIKRRQPLPAGDVPRHRGGHRRHPARWPTPKSSRTLCFEANPLSEALDVRIDAISDLALEVTQSVLARTEEAQSVMEDENGPLTLARALSDFFQIAGGLEAGAVQLEQDELEEFCAYGLDLLDRLAFLVRKVEIMDKRDTVAIMFASMGVWVARRGATIDNLEGTADGFGMIVNGTHATEDLRALCEMMLEVIEAASVRLQLDEDRGDAWRPWRVINLNAGIAATRSLDPELMRNTFEGMGRRCRRICRASSRMVCARRLCRTCRMR